MKNDKIIFLLIFNLLTIFHIYAQPATNYYSNFLNELDTLSNRANHEIAYIQTDKDIYETGEDIWFKIYLLDAKDLILSTSSKTIYVELFNEADKKIVWQEKYSATNGFSSGNILLERALSEGEYILAVYTPYSLFSNTKDLYQVKRIKVCENVIPKVPFNVNCSKKYYSLGDSIQVLISPTVLIKDSLFADIQVTLEQKGKRLSRQKTKTSGKGYATLSLPTLVCTGDLFINAVIKYKNKEKIVNLPLNCLKNSIQFKVFPEGGDLIDGLPCKMAFKAVDTNGEPLEIKGVLYENDSPIMEFKSIHFGMGLFNYTPVKSNKYYIKITDPEIDSVFSLPEIKSDGISLQLISSNNENLVFRISKSNVGKKTNIFLRLQNRGEVYFFQKVVLSNKVILKIPVNKLPMGVVEATVFDYNLCPVAERLVFINTEKMLNISVTLSKNIVNVKDRVDLKVSVTDDKGIPVIANMGISVFEKIYQDSLSESNILAFYQLSTQIKGKIHNPSYYFNPINKNRKAALDLLMLTQGWRKYVWNESNLIELTKSKKPVLWNDVKGEIIYPVQKRQIEGNGIIEAFSSDPSKGVRTTIFDLSEKEFTIPYETLDNWHNSFFYIRLLVYKGNYFEILIQNPFETISKIIKDNKAEYYLPFKSIDYQAEPVKLDVSSPGVTSLQTIVFSKIKTIKYVANTLVGDYVCRQNVLNCPRHVFEEDYRRPINGKKYFVNTFVNTKNEKVYSITYPEIPGNLVPIISQPFLSESMIETMKNYIVKGYYKGKEFYQPNYDEVKEDLDISDYRKTILWEPNIITDKKGEATVSFFCSDINSLFVGRIEGVGEGGLLGSGSFNFIVKEKK